MRSTRRIRLGVLLSLLLVAAVAICIDTAQAQQAAPGTDKPKADATPQIQWQPTFDDALKKAKADAKPVFIDFYGDRCGYCRLFDEKTLTDDSIRKALADFVPVKVNVQSDPETAGKYSVRPIPDFVITDADGAVIVRSAGYRPPEAFAKFLAYAGGRHALKKDPKDREGAYQAAANSYTVDIADSERLELANVALKLTTKRDRDKRAVLLLVRAKAAGGSIAESDPQRNAKMAETINDVKAARTLDPANKLGVKEEADLFVIRLDRGTAEDKSKALVAYLKHYPLNKLKNPILRASALQILASLRERFEDYAGAIKVLETLKAEFKDRLDPQPIDAKIQELRRAAGVATPNTS